MSEATCSRAGPQLALQSKMIHGDRPRRKAKGSHRHIHVHLIANAMDSVFYGPINPPQLPLRETIWPAMREALLPKTVSVYREGYGLSRLQADALAGLTVAIVALPLSMAIAIASGVPELTGESLRRAERAHAVIRGGATEPVGEGMREEFASLLALTA